LKSNYSIFKISYESCVDKMCKEFREVYVNNYQKNEYQEVIEIPIFREFKDQIVYFEYSYSTKPVIVPYSNQDILGKLLVYRPCPPNLEYDIFDFLKKYIDGNDNASRYITYRSNLYSAMGFSLVVCLVIFAWRNYYIEAVGRKLIASKLRERFSNGN